MVTCHCHIIYRLGSFDRELRRKPVKEKQARNNLSDQTLGPAVVPKQVSHLLNTFGDYCVHFMAVKKKKKKKFPPISNVSGKELLKFPTFSYHGGKSLLCYYQGNLKGESVVAVILPSHINVSYCSGRFFRS